MKELRIYLVFLAVALLSATSFSAVPALMNYQGLLTDNNNVPLLNVNRSVDFTIYDAAVGGATIWGPETHSVTTDGSGRFNVILGQGAPPVPLTDAAFSGDERWLGIKVAADPELTPRTRITTSAYAHRIATVDGATGGTITGDVTLQSTLTADNLVAGDATTAGTVTVDAGTGMGLPTNGTFGNYFGFSDAYSYWCGDFTCSNGIGLSGGGFGGGNPFIIMPGSTNSLSLDMSTVGDGSVSLPSDAVSSGEILDEPGIVADRNSSIFDLAVNPTMTTLETITMTTPAAGYVVVEAKCYVRLSGGTSYNFAYVQIDTTAGGGIIFPYYTLAGFGTSPNTGEFYFPMYVTRVYYFTTPRTITFELEGTRTGGTGAPTASSWDHMITATYYPTSYGSVVTALAGNQASQFEQATLVPQRETPGMVAASTEPMYEVDLRELELKVAKTRAEAEKAQRELLQAQMKLNREKALEAAPKFEQKQ